MIDLFQNPYEKVIAPTDDYQEKLFTLLDREDFEQSEEKLVETIEQAIFSEVKKLVTERKDELRESSGSAFAVAAELGLDGRSLELVEEELIEVSNLIAAYSAISHAIDQHIRNLEKEISSSKTISQKKVDKLNKLKNSLERVSKKLDEFKHQQAKTKEKEKEVLTKAASKSLNLESDLAAKREQLKSAEKELESAKDIPAFLFPGDSLKLVQASIASSVISKIASIGQEIGSLVKLSKSAEPSSKAADASVSKQASVPEQKSAQTAPSASLDIAGSQGLRLAKSEDLQKEKPRQKNEEPDIDKSRIAQEISKMQAEQARIARVAELLTSEEKSMGKRAVMISGATSIAKDQKQSFSEKLHAQRSQQSVSDSSPIKKDKSEMSTASLMSYYSSMGKKK
jgi:hypothetical protein